MRYFIFLSLLVIMGCREQEFRYPAEFEPQSAVWLIWPTIEHVADLKNSDITRQLIDTLLPHVGVRLVCANDSIADYVRSVLPKTTLNHPQFNIHVAPNEGFWARDMGPVFVKKGTEAWMADQSFSNWGSSDSVAAQTDESLDEVLAAQLGLPVWSSDILCEGGNHETNGKGVLMATETVEKQRNPSLSLPQIEEKYRKLYGVTHFIWMKRGVHEDDFPWDSPIAGPGGKEVYTLLTTGGHIDEFARFADDSTILIAQVDIADLADDPIARENQIRLAENLKIAQAARQPNGKPYRILTMPMPKTIVRTLRPGDVTYDLTATMPFTKKPFPKGQPILGVAAASYLNFLITNDIVIAQRYGQTGDPANIARDEQARQVLQTAFPTRRIIMLDALAINWGGGGIHCITAHQPK